jgi:NAD(P)-dependent dehydrogenase (short-subunit alcohol dehydrogenase family)
MPKIAPEVSGGKDRQIALVTGAGKGIGRAIVLRLVREGYCVVINDVDPEGAAQTLREASRAGGKAVSHICNVGDRAAVRRMVGEVIQNFGQIDVLVNNAGIARLGLIADLSEEDWRNVFRVNVDGVFFCSQAVVPHMISRGKGGIVNMSSWNGKVGMPIFGAYCATKFAVIGLTQALAKEVAPYGIRVNAVCPGVVAETAMRHEIEQVSPLFNIPPSNERAKTIPLKRLALPEDVARAVNFLLSDEAGYMTGQAINVTGGLWMH